MTHGRRLLAVLLLLASMAPWVAPHAIGDDPWCAPLEAGFGTPSFKATVTGAEQPQHHCAICHSIRSYRAALTDCGPAIGELNTERLIAAGVSDRPAAPDSVRLPARAPPA